MHKPILINLDKYSGEEWIDLPQGTRLHPKEIEKMFDDKEMGEEGNEYMASISKHGDINDESYGNNNSVKLNKPMTYNYAKEAVMTHSHPRFNLKQDIDEGIVVEPALSNYDLENNFKEDRVFSQNLDHDTGQIHAFKIDDRGTKKDVIERKKLGDNLLYEMKEIINLNKDKPKFINSMQTVKGYPMSSNMFTASEFNLARRGAGNASIINIRKTNEPNKIEITKVRSTNKDNNTAYDLLSTLPRKKKLIKPMANRINLDLNIKPINIAKFNLDGLNSMLIGRSKKKIVAKLKRKTCSCKKKI